jgi:hypothetical protein
MQLYAIENNKVGSEPVAPGDMALFRTYIKTGVALEAALPNDMFGNPFTMTTLEGGPKLSKDSYDALSDVVPLQFWEPYYP